MRSNWKWFGRVKRSSDWSERKKFRPSPRPTGSQRTSGIPVFESSSGKRPSNSHTQTLPTPVQRCWCRLGCAQGAPRRLPPQNVPQLKQLQRKRHVSAIPNQRHFKNMQKLRPGRMIDPFRRRIVIPHLPKEPAN